jgi:gliding motility-associated-like protein
LSSTSGAAITIDYSGIATSGNLTVIETITATGCSTTNTQAITVNPLLTVSVAIAADVNPLCAGATVAFTATPGNGGLTPSYQWYNGVTAVGTDSPTYAYVPTNGDVISVILTSSETCQSGGPATSNTVTMTVNPVLPVSVAIAADVNPVCTGTTVTFTAIPVNGGLTPSYQWYNGVTAVGTDSPSYSYVALNGDVISVVLTSIETCQSGGPATSNTVTMIVNPTPTATNIKTDVLCQGTSTGAIDLTVSGGVLPYTSLWSNGAVTEDINGLSAGTYTATITDGNGCITTAIGIITEPAAITGNTVITNTTCAGGNTGSIDLSVAGGTAPYTFLWSNGAVTEDVNGLSAGSYSVRITDVNSCPSTVNVVISEPAAFTFTLDNVVQNTCFGSNNAGIDITLAGGTSPYLISWTGPNSFTASTEDIVNLSPGLYSLNATDANGCITYTSSTTITEPAQITITNDTISSYTGFGVACNLGSDGFISTTISGGTGALTIGWTGPSGFSSSSDDISGLSAGSYIISVTDTRGCSATQTYQLTEPEVLSVSSIVIKASCPGVTDGAIDLTISGGTGPYSIIWADGIATEDRISIPDGTYNVIVTDINGCTNELDIVVGVVGINCIEIPDVITPNGDGKNDEWKFRNVELYPNAEVFVYNRWGELIFRTKNLGANPWDGKEDGKLVPTDSYHYILYLNDGTPARTGVVTVIR